MSPNYNYQNVMHSLLKISSLVVESKDLTYLYQEIHEIIQDIMYAKNFVIGLYDSDNRSVLFEYFEDEKDGEAGKTMKGKSLSIGEGMSSYVIESRKPTLFSSEDILKLQWQGKMNALGSLPVSWMAAPIQNKDTVHGIIITQSYTKDQIYTEDDLDVLTFVASHLSIVFETKMIIDSEKSALKLIHKNFDMINKQNIELENTLRELKEAQTELIEKEKMASLGGLVAGIAHEVNTPIGICVTGASNLITISKDFQNKCETGTATDQDLENLISDVDETSTILLSNSRKAAHLVSSFKMVAVDQSSNEIRNFAVAQYLDEVMLSLRPMLKKLPYKINIKCSKEIHLHSIPGALSQVITNLVTNSINHGFEDRTEGQITIDIIPTAEGILLKYKDNGKGMEEHQLSQLFEPFYTTKRGHGGSGLGAHLIYNLVTQSLNGKLSVSSPPGEGLMFEISLANLKAHQ